MPIVTVYHNNNPAQTRHRGYDTSDTVTEVFHYDFGDSGDDNGDVLDGESANCSVRRTPSIHSTATATPAMSRTMTVTT